MLSDFLLVFLKLVHFLKNCFLDGILMPWATNSNGAVFYPPTDSIVKVSLQNFFLFFILTTEFHFASVLTFQFLSPNDLLLTCANYGILHFVMSFIPHLLLFLGIGYFPCHFFFKKHIFTFSLSKK